MKENKELLQRSVKTNIEIREEGEGKRTITGFIPYDSKSEYLGWFYEKISNTAFNKTLQDGYDVKALVDHDSSKVLGRVKNNSLRLRSEDDGLHIECDLPDTSYARDAYELIKSGYNDTMSFGFRIIEQDYSQDDAGIELHILREVKLEEVSFCVAFPAYKETKSEARSLEKISNLLDKDELDDNEKSELRDFIDALNQKLEVREKPVEDLINTEAEQNLTSAIEEDQQFVKDIRSQLKEIFGENYGRE